MLFDRVGAGNVIGKRVVVEEDRHGFAVLLLLGRLPGAQSGVFGLELAVVGFQCTVAVFEVQDLGDPGDVDALGDEVADPRQAIQIVVAVAARAAVGARWGEQSAPLVEPHGLRIDPAELRGHRDAIYAARRSHQGIVRH